MDLKNKPNQLISFIDQDSRLNLQCLPPKEIYLLDIPNQFKFNTELNTERRVCFDIDIKTTTIKSSTSLYLKENEYSILTRFEQENRNTIQLLKLNRSDILRYLYYFELDPVKTGNFIKKDLAILRSKYFLPLKLSLKVIEHEQTINLLTSGFIYCLGRDKKYRPNLYINLDLLKIEVINNKNNSIFSIKQKYYHIKDIISALYYMISYIIYFCMCRIRIEQMNLIVYYSERRVKSNIFNENFLKTNFKLESNQGNQEEINENSRFTIYNVIEEVINSVGRLFPYRFNRFFLHNIDNTVKTKKNSEEKSISNREKLILLLKTRLITSLKIENNDILINNHLVNRNFLIKYISIEYLEVKLNGNIKNIIYNFFPPKMFSIGIEYNNSSKYNTNNYQLDQVNQVDTNQHRHSLYYFDKEEEGNKCHIIKVNHRFLTGFYKEKDDEVDFIKENTKSKSYLVDITTNVNSSSIREEKNKLFSRQLTIEDCFEVKGVENLYKNQVEIEDKLYLKYVSTKECIDESMDKDEHNIHLKLKSFPTKEYEDYFLQQSSLSEEEKEKEREKKEKSKEVSEVSNVYKYNKEENNNNKVEGIYNKNMKISNCSFEVFNNCDNKCLIM